MCFCGSVKSALKLMSQKVMCELVTLLVGRKSSANFKIWEGVLSSRHRHHIWHASLCLSYPLLTVYREFNRSQTIFPSPASLLALLANQFLLSSASPSISKHVYLCLLNANANAKGQVFSQPEHPAYPLNIFKHQAVQAGCKHFFSEHTPWIRKSHWRAAVFVWVFSMALCWSASHGWPRRRFAFLKWPVFHCGKGTNYWVCGCTGKHPILV